MNEIEQCIMEIKIYGFTILDGVVSSDVANQMR